MISKSDVSSRYELSKEKLGEGTYGKVYKGRDTYTNQPVAIKKIKYSDVELGQTLMILREISLLRYLKNQDNIIQLLAVEFYDGHVELVFEQFGINLEIIIKNVKANPVLSNVQLQCIIYQILMGTYFIHSHDLVHRDLKPSNILVDGRCKIKICDFGHARYIQYAPGEGSALDRELLSKNMSGYIQTRWYRSFETLLGHNRPGEAPSDMWSIGCILGELFTRKNLFDGESIRDVLDMIFNVLGTPTDYRWLKNADSIKLLKNTRKIKPANLQRIFVSATPDALTLITKLLELDPNKRITAEMALREPFLQPFFQIEDLNVTQNSVNQTSCDKNSWSDYMDFEFELNQYSSIDLCMQAEKLSLEAQALIQKEALRYTEHQTAAIDEKTSIAEEVDVEKSPRPASSSFAAPQTPPSHLQKEEDRKLSAANTIVAFFYNRVRTHHVVPKNDTTSTTDHKVDSSPVEVYQLSK